MSRYRPKRRRSRSGPVTVTVDPSIVLTDAERAAAAERHAYLIAHPEAAGYVPPQGTTRRDLGIHRPQPRGHTDGGRYQ